MGIENKFERPTPQQRTDELRDVAAIIGNPPTSIIFGEGGLTTSIIGISPHPFQDSVIPGLQAESTISEQRGPEGKSGKSKKEKPPIKPNQLRHAQNLRGFYGRLNGIFYENGRPMKRKANNINGTGKNGNGKY